MCIDYETMATKQSVEVPTVPTLFMAHVKQWLAIAAFLASIGHNDSLQNSNKKGGGYLHGSWAVNTCNLEPLYQRNQN